MLLNNPRLVILLVQVFLGGTIFGLLSAMVIVNLIELSERKHNE